MKKLVLAFLATFLFWLPAQAIVELRAGYGINTVGDYESSTGNNLEIAGFAGFNLDAILELPLLPVGLGVRYESMGFDVKQGALESSADFERISAIVNYRFIDMFAYFGLIGTLGLVNDVTIKSGGLIAAERKYDASLTSSVGVEAGVSLGLLMFGAEAGYFMGTYKDKGTPALNDMDAGGIYAKVLVGVGL